MMAPIREEMYLSYNIKVYVDPRISTPLFVATCDILSPDGKRFRFRECLDPFVQHTAIDWPKNDDEAAKQLADQTLRRARSAIDLNRVSELDGADFQVDC